VKRALIVAAIAVALTGCGGANDDDPTLTSEFDSSSPTAAAPSVAGPAVPGPAVPSSSKAACTSQPPVAEGAKGSTDLTSKPKVTIPSGPPPCNLVISDLVVGTGAEAIPGKNVTVKYVGVTYATGKEFDASWGGTDFTFGLGGQQVIAGWDQGFAGMREGGRRQLVIPPDLAYGEQGSPPDIPPGATLIFVVDLVKVG
jgi:peptidylprolyl isomerase